MPFQLDTRMYGGGGDDGGGRQANPFGQLGSLMDMQLRQQALESQQEQRALINEQRQQAMGKVAKEQAEERSVREFLDKNPHATEADLTKLVGPERASKIFEGRFKNEQSKLEAVASGYGSVLALPDDQQEQAFHEIQGDLLRRGVITQEETTPTYSKAHAMQAQSRVLTALQQINAATAQKHADVAVSTEKRLGELQPIQVAKTQADLEASLLAKVIPRLSAVATPQDYQREWELADDRIRGTLPTPGEYAKDPKRTLGRLATLGMSPSERLAAEDRDLTRAMMERHHQETERRARESDQTITNAMRNAAITNYGNAKERLEERIADAKARNQPYSPSAIKKMEIQAEMSYARDLRLPPSLQLAEEYKELSFDELRRTIANRSQPQSDGTIKNPMSQEELEREQLAIHNRFLRDTGQKPVSELPASYGGKTKKKAEAGADVDTKPYAGASAANFNVNPTPRFGPVAQPGGPGQLGALVNPQQAAPAPPVVGPPQQGPPPPAQGPVPAQGAPGLTADEFREIGSINAEMAQLALTKKGAPDYAAKQRRFHTIYVRLQQLQAKQGQ